MEKRIGFVTHYYNNLGVAVLDLDDGLKVGDTIHLSGYTTDFVQEVRSLEVDHRRIQAAGAGADVALKVDQRVRAGDAVYKVLRAEPALHF
jgi:putative protease